MMYRPYGASGLNLSVIGFGGMRFEAIDDEDACAAMVQHAYDGGINYFDTAPGYFGGKSEERFGLAFRRMASTRAQRPFYVATKSNKGDPDEIRRDLEASLTRMGLDYVDIFYMWWVVRPQWYYDRKARGALKAFEALKAEGLVRHIALSSHMAGDEIAEVLADYPFDGVLLGYSAANFTFRGPALAAAASLNRGVVTMNPLAGGVIPRHADRFGFLRTRDDETVVQAALRFLVNDPRITVALVGFGTAAHIDEALEAERGFRPIPPPRIEAMRGRLAREFDAFCTGCGYCLPCPAKLSLPRLMQCYNEFLLGGTAERVLSTMKWQHDVSDEPLDACTDCGACEQRCTQKLPIRERLRKLNETRAAAAAAEK